MWRKYITSLFLGCLVACSFSAHAGPVSTYGQLKVQGNKIVSTRTGQAVQLKGYSTHGLQWFPYTVGGGGTLEYMVKDFGIQVVRLAMYVHESDQSGRVWGYLGSDPNIYINQVRPLIKDAIANDIYVIVDWHIHWNPTDPNNKHWTPNPYTTDAQKFFDMVAKEFGSAPNIIYEVINEPGSKITWLQVKNHAIPVYQTIRNVDPDNLILVPGPNWAQDIAAVAADPLQNVSNVAYTIHFYAQSHEFRVAADGALAKGLAIWASEWGMTDHTGDGAIDTSSGGKSDLWVNWMRDNQISWTSWNFSNKSETSAALTTGATLAGGGWSDNQIKPSGKWIRERINEAAIGAIIEAEDYVTMVGIKVQATTDDGGGYNIGYIDANDWMSYSINVPTAGKYVVSYRVASLNGGGSIKLQNQAKTTVYGNIPVPKTNGWQVWTTISHEVTLPAGSQSIVLVAPTGGYNVNWLKLEPAAATSSSAASSQASSASSSSVSSAASSAPSSRSSASSSAASSAGVIKCTQIVSNDWGSGFTGAIRFTNKGAAPINGWTITWKYSDATKVTANWNATVTGSNPYSATNLSTNAVIQPGQSVDIGFNVNKGSSVVNRPTFGGACL